MLYSKRTKIVVCSLSDLCSGVGHRTRILSILNTLQYQVSPCNLEWLNITPGLFNLFLLIRNLKKTYSSYPFRITFFPYISIPLIKHFYSWVWSILIFCYLFARYGRGKEVILWIEMGSSAWPFILYKRIFRVPCVLDLHGTVDEKIQHSPFSQRAAISYSISIYEELNALHYADVLITVSQQMVDIYRSRYKYLPAKTIVLPIFSTSAKRESSERARQKTREQLGFRNNLVFVYSGGLQSWQCISEMLDVFEQICKSNESAPLEPVLMFLTWEAQHKLQEMFDQRDIPKKRIFICSVPQNEVHDYLLAGDIGLLFREKLTTNLVASPTKATEYLSAGLPILCTPYVGDISKIVANENVGLVIDIWKPLDMERLSEWCKVIALQRNSVAQRCNRVHQRYVASNSSANIINSILSTISDFKDNKFMSNT